MANMLSIIDSNGVERFLGNNPPPTATPTKLTKVYGDFPNQPMLKRDQWKPVDMSAFLSPIKNQHNVGACNAFSSVYVLEGCRAVQGVKHELLSPGYLYGLINGGVDQGSMLEDAIHTLIQVGTCKASTVGELDWRHRPTAAQEEARGFRLLEAYWCPQFDHMASAIQAGFFVSSGLPWYDNFNTDGDGWLPLRGQGRWGGHAVCRSGLVLNKDGKTWGLSGPNSWGDSWGASGCMTIAETLYTEAIGGFWCARAVIDEGNVIPLPAN